MVAVGLSFVLFVINEESLQAGNQGQYMLDLNNDRRSKIAGLLWETYGA